MIRQVSEYEKGLLFTLGRYTKTLDPGWHIVIPIFQSFRKVDVRVMVDDVPEQEAITKDNVSIKINEVIY
jgi:regulator of protease activity HflC (stomatin/prohibitin superfamily)